MSDDAAWRERFGEFVAEPTGARYRSLQDLVVSHPTFVPGPSALTRIFTAEQQQRDADVIAELNGSSPALVLSPVARFTAAKSAACMGNPIIALVEDTAGRACMKGLVATGDGSEASPYRVLYRAEVAVVLMALGTDARSDRTVRRGATVFQVVECLDERQRWFDVSATVPADAPREAPPAQRRDGPRAHHYHFAQTYWPKFVFQKAAMLRDVIDDNDELSTMAHTLWRVVGRGLDAADVLPVDGLKAFGSGAGEGRHCVIVGMPPPERPPEAYLIAAFFDAEPRPETTRYYTMEMSVGAPAFVCGIDADGKRRSYQPVKTLDSDAFFDVVFALEAARSAPG